MGRKFIPYLLAYVPLLAIYILFLFVKYQLKVRKYRKIIFRTMRKEGIPKKMAKSLVSNIKIIKIRDLLKYGNMKNIL